MTTHSTMNKDTLLWMYSKMVTIRRFEEQSRREADAGKLRGMHSSIGQEAVPTGISAHLRDDDFVLGTHRSHHHCIAKGVDINKMMAELLGKSTGTNNGKGGTMHIADIDKGMLGANGVVGSNIPVATGVALSAMVRGTDQVSVVFFGDGASSQGVLHESMNLASIWKLPVLFVCENNRYAEATPFEFTVAGGSISNRAAGYDIPGVSVDGQSVLDVFEVGGEAVARARRGEGPTLIEAQTYRYQGHFGADDPLGYRSEEEQEYYMARDCIKQLTAHLIENGFAGEDDLQKLDEEALAAVEAAARQICLTAFTDKVAESDAEHVRNGRTSFKTAFRTILGEARHLIKMGIRPFFASLKMTIQSMRGCHADSRETMRRAAAQVYSYNLGDATIGAICQQYLCRLFA
ncbi:MAG: thiamine pyrophosphate-dependent dehydrogenase E1 component subunit alpha, partial [Chloroflexi bacterium]|nr:thiamine pyrophosphate-dependent dehydrogenase E1 component subunit alpha [Chloroflexota bacterium]